MVVDTLLGQFRVVMDLVPLILGWIVTSLVLFIAGRIVSGREATLGEAFMIALVGPILIGITMLITKSFFGPLLSLLIAFIIWIWTIKTVFDIGWGAAFLISILSSITLVVVIVITAILLGIASLLFTFMEFRNLKIPRIPSVYPLFRYIQREMPLFH